MNRKERVGERERVKGRERGIIEGRREMGCREEEGKRGIVEGRSKKGLEKKRGREAL